MRDEKHSKEYKVYYDNKQTNKCVLTGLHTTEKKILKKEKNNPTNWNSHMRISHIHMCVVCTYVVRAICVFALLYYFLLCVSSLFLWIIVTSFVRLRNALSGIFCSLCEITFLSCVCVEVYAHLPIKPK